MAVELPEPVALKGEESVHVSIVAEVLLPPGLYTDSVLPGVYELEDAGHDRAGEGGRAFWEASDELIEELFGGDLEMEGVAALGNEGV
ncbi:hypothetical protein C0993_012779 [Termitomyces sp. T159_Od127]|nr:hypothetical protein C0993_012779 [Termitomyces sp. T159_Od127]